MTLGRFSVLLADAGLLLLVLALHVAMGAKSGTAAKVVQALIWYDPQDQFHLVLFELRLPRAIAAALTGAALAAAGVLVQAVSRNPLADPGTLGLLAGGASAVVLGIGWLGLAGMAFAPLFAAIGTVLAGGLAWLIALAVPPSGRIAALLLAGAAITAFLTALDSAILLLDEETYRGLRVWLAGSFTGLRWPTLHWAAPWAVVGLVLSLTLAPALSVLAMTEDSARALGLSPARARGMAAVAVVLCTASAVAMAGMLIFVGLVVPHVARLIVGGDFRRILPASVLLGAIYVPLVDLLARMLLAPQEIATGLLSALMGAPLFLWLIKVRT